MSLYKYSFWEVFKHSFSAEVWDKVLPAIGETMYMVAVSSVFVLIFGILLGLVLVMTSREGLVPCRRCTVFSVRSSTVSALCRR